MPFQPVVDGHLLPQPPFDAVRAGLSSNVRVLVGTNRDEMTLFGLGEVDDNGLRRIAARIFTDADAALAAYRKASLATSDKDFAHVGKKLDILWTT